MKLYVGTDSSWSLRALLCFDIARVTPEVSVFQLNNEISRLSLKQLSPTGLVPFLIDDQNVINDSLAIVEYLYERENHGIYPSDPAQRALSRSLCAEIHSGFMAIRQEMPFSAKGDVRRVSISSQAETELVRLESIFSQSSAGFFWGEVPTAVDAFYAVMAFRLTSYGIDFKGNAGRYQQSLVEWDCFKQGLKKIS